MAKKKKAKVKAKRKGGGVGKVSAKDKAYARATYGGIKSRKGETGSDPSKG